MRRITISVSDETARWLEKEVEKKRFRSLSHGCEYAIIKLGETEGI